MFDWGGSSMSSFDTNPRTTPDGMADMRPSSSSEEDDDSYSSSGSYFTSLFPAPRKRSKFGQVLMIAIDVRGRLVARPPQASGVRNPIGTILSYTFLGRQVLTK